MLRGDIVQCVTRQYAQIPFAWQCTIEYVKQDGRLKLRGYRHLYNRNNFIVIQRAAQAVPVANKPAPAVVKEPAKPKTLLEELKDKIKGEAGTCSYALEFADGSRRFQIRDACHYRIRHHSRDGYCTSSKDPKDVKPVAVALNISGHVSRFKGERIEQYKAFVKYILDDSPWSKAFLTKYSDDVMNDGVLLDVTQSYSFVCSAAIALRVGSEYPTQLTYFKELIDMKYSGNVAFVLSQVVQKEENNKYSLRSQGGGHHVFNTGHDAAQLLAFFNEGKLNLDDGKYEDAAGKPYQIQNVIAPTLGGFDTPNSLGFWLTEYNKEMIKEVGEGWGRRKTVTMDGLLGLCKVANTLARRMK